MRLETVRAAVATELRKIDKADKKIVEERPKAVKKDSADFSSNATTTAQETKGLASRIAIEPEVRTERINEVKEKISNGFYNTNEFADKLADNLTGHFLS